MQQYKPTEKYQRDLANFCRTGDYIPIPGVKEKNVYKYRELIYNVVNDSLQAAYPLTNDLLKKQEWEELVHNFFRSHRCRSPQIWQMPKELYEFVKESEDHLQKKYPYIIDLLLFEWMEIEVYMMNDIEPGRYTTLGNFKIDELVLNPEIRILSLQYPVHFKNTIQIAAEDAGQYYVGIHRDPDTGRVHFTDIQYPHVEVIEKLLEAQPNYQTLVDLFSKYASPEIASEALNNFIKASLDSKLLLGYSISCQN